MSGHGREIDREELERMTADAFRALHRIFDSSPQTSMVTESERIAAADTFLRYAGHVEFDEDDAEESEPLDQELKLVCLVCLKKSEHITALGSCQSCAGTEKEREMLFGSGKIGG